MDLVSGALKQSADHNQLVQLYWIARYDYEPNWVFPEHIHDFWQIIYIIEGEGDACLAGRKFNLVPGLILFMPPGVPHSLLLITSPSMRTLDVKFGLGRGEFCETMRAMHTPAMDSDNQVLHILSRIHKEAIRSEPGHRELCNALMIEALVHMLRASTGDTPAELPETQHSLEDTLVQRTCDLVHQRFAEAVTLQEVSHALGVSPQHLTKRFKKTVGTTVHEYLLRYRVERAKEFLSASRRPIKQIAFDVGFKSVHHFTRVFSRLEHTPPGAWRERQSGVGRRGITVTPGFVSTDVTVDGHSNELIGL